MQRRRQRSVPQVAEADLDVVRRFREALDKDESAAVALLAPDVEFVHPRGVMHGIEEVREKWLRSGGGSGPTDLDMEFEEGKLEDLGNGRVGAINHQVYRWKESGELAYERYARIEYVVRDGKIARYEAKLLDAPP